MRQNVRQRSVLGVDVWFVITNREVASSHRRHGYYCRSKTPGPAKSRKRSCNACARAKIRCDSKLPNCSGCASRKCECMYDDAALLNMQTTTTPESNNLLFDSPNSAETDLLSLPSSVLPLAPFLQTGTEDNGSSNISEVNFDFNMLGMAPADNDFALSDFDPAPSFYSLESQYMDFTPLSPLQWKPAKAIRFRKLQSPQAEMAATLLTHIISAIPRKMVRTDTFPPFIHPKCYARSDDGEMSETLMNCMVLAKMFASRTKESHRILWRAIRTEQERLSSQVYSVGSAFPMVLA